MASFPRQKFQPKRPLIKENVNQGIRFAEVRVIFPDGTNEILKTYIAIERAKELGLDLIVVSPTATPPVAKIIDEGKWAFEEKKKKNLAKKNQHVTQVKELKFSPNTDDHDYDFKRKHATDWLAEGHKVKAVVRFKGREIAHTDIGRKLLDRLVTDLATSGKAEALPRQDGKNAFVVIAPVKK